MYDVFFSYNSKDLMLVEAIASQLSKQGLVLFLDRWYLVPGIPWPQHLENILNNCKAVVVFLGPNPMGPWQQREQYLALELQTKKPSFPVIPVLLPGSDPPLGFLALNTWTDLRKGLDDKALVTLKYAILGQAIIRDASPNASATLASICPYKGLKSFREEDAGFFFGRTQFIGRLVKMVEQNSLVAVIGHSGSGKSSVVQAGLIPYLRQSKTIIWDTLSMVPNSNPILSLSASLVPLLEPNLSEVDRLREINKLAEGIYDNTIRLKSVILRILEKQRGTDRLLIIVDQWEELYTQVSNKTAREKFLSEILDATSGSPLSITLTLRGDFYSQLLEYRPFSDRIQDSIVNISELNREELVEIIEAPAIKTNLAFEPGLIDRIINDLQSSLGHLPLLEFLLMELWKEREDSLLTHEAYKHVGELKGAIAKHAEAQFLKLALSEQEIARRILLNLVRPASRQYGGSKDISNEPSRRRVGFSQLEDQYINIVRKLADAHLVTTGRDEASGNEVIDLIHEALIKEWSRLDNWLHDDVSFLSWREKLRTISSILEESGKLLDGELLNEAKQWLKKREPDLNISEKKFITSSLKKAKKVFWLNLTTVLISLALLYFVVQLSINRKRGKNEDPKQQMSEEKSRQISDSDFSKSLNRFNNLRTKQISEKDFVESSKLLRCEVETIKAVVDVLKPDNGFLSDGRVSLLFEGHHFYRLTKGAYATTHPTICYQRWTNKFYAKGSADIRGAGELARLAEAMELDSTAALMSTSFGKFDLMGFDFKLCGFNTVQEFYKAITKSEGVQLIAFCNYLISNKLDDPLRKHEWAIFSRSFLGPEFKENSYAIRLKRTYETYKNKSK